MGWNPITYFLIFFSMLIIFFFFFFLAEGSKEGSEYNENSAVVVSVILSYRMERVNM